MTWADVFEILKYLASIGIGAFLLEWYRNFKNKKKNALEVTKSYMDGRVMEIQFKTDLNNLVEQSVAPLKKKIEELENTIVDNAVKYAHDLRTYVNKMAEMEIKLNAQVEKNQILETKLEQERMAKDDCNVQIAKLKNRVAELEALKK